MCMCTCALFVAPGGHDARPRRGAARCRSRGCFRAGTSQQIHTNPATATEDMRGGGGGGGGGGHPRQFVDRGLAHAGTLAPPRNGRALRPDDLAFQTPHEPSILDIRFIPLPPPPSPPLASNEQRGDGDAVEV